MKSLFWEISDKLDPYFDPKRRYSEFDDLVPLVPEHLISDSNYDGPRLFDHAYEAHWRTNVMIIEEHQLTIPNQVKRRLDTVYDSVFVAHSFVRNVIQSHCIHIVPAK